VKRRGGWRGNDEENESEKEKRYVYV